MTVYFGNLRYEVTEIELREILKEYGRIIKIRVPKDYETGRSRGFAFIDMSTPEEEEHLIQELDEAEWMERELKVRKATPRQR